MRLGIDMGTNSIGWWLYKLTEKKDICDSIAGGVRIFSNGLDPKTESSLAVARREARSMRRRRDRYIRRRSALLKKLTEAGLMPRDPVEAKLLERLDPYVLRAQALDDKLPLYHIGRALFHINQRRGFKSNRKTDAKDNESGKIKDGAARLDIAMATNRARTYGEFLAKRRASAEDSRAIPQVRTRLATVISGDKTVKGYDFYPTRMLLDEEFRRICKEQAEYYPDILTDELINELHQIIFYQRKLKAPKIGRCLFNAHEERLPMAHPLFQERRLYETVNALHVREAGKADRPLTREERDVLIMTLRDKQTSAFTALRKIIKLKPNQRFSHETANRKKLIGDEIRAVLGDKTCFGTTWQELSVDEQYAVICILRDSESHDEVLDRLKANYYAIGNQRAENIAKATLPTGYGRVGITATKKIVEALKNNVVTYDKAVAEAGYHHSDHRTGEAFDYLPYYGEILPSSVSPGSNDPDIHDPIKDAPEYWGRIANPTVHIALGQLRHLINDIIKIYGKPTEIVVELGRDLKNTIKQKDEINKKIKENTDAAISRGEKLDELELKNNGGNRMLMRIWERLHNDPTKRCCPYCLKPIGIKNLFDGSTDVDHILPFSKTLDDGIANKVICHTECNREKSNQTPYETWNTSDRWYDIVANSMNLPEGTRWRFNPDAMVRFTDQNGFMQRQLTDMQYIARVAREYLSRLYPEKGQGSSHVWCVPGKLTAHLRWNWGLDEILDNSEDSNRSKKNRQDHRHHAIDAAVIGATDRGLVNRLSKAEAKAEDEGRQKRAKVSPPFAFFRDNIKTMVSNIIVSHRADHGTVIAGDSTQSAARLHNDTAYGLTGEDSDNVVYRKSLTSLKYNDFAHVRDPNLKKNLCSIPKGLDKKDFKVALEKFSQDSPTYRNLRRVRLIDKMKVIRIRDRDGKVYKGFKGDSNHCVEVWDMPDGKWQSKVLTTFDAHQNGLGSTRPHPAARLKMRIYKDDIVRWDDHRNGEQTARIVMIKKAGKICLTPSNEANVDARNRNKSDPFSYITLSFGPFKKYSLRKVGVDRLGRVRDGGIKASGDI